MEIQLLAFLTLTLDGGEWSAVCPGKGPLLPLGQEAGWARSWSRHGGKEKNVFPTVS